MSSFVSCITWQQSFPIYFTKLQKHIRIAYPQRLDENDSKLFFMSYFITKGKYLLTPGGGSVGLYCSYLTDGNVV